MITIIKNMMLLLILLVLAAPCYAESAISDPLQDYLGYKIERLTKDDSVYTLTVDLNEDGVPDYFYSSTAPGSQVSRRGALAWHAYLSTEQGYIKSDKGMDLNTATASLNRLANGKLALMYLFIGTKDSGTYIAYYVDDQNQLQSMEISKLEDTQESARSMEFTPVDEAAQRVQETVTPLTEVASPELMARAYDPTKAFDYKKKMVVDDYKADLIYYFTEDLSELLGIREYLHGAIIPMGTINVSIRTLITKRALARIKGVELTSEQDRVELEQIMTWFEAWNKLYGQYHAQFKAVELMTKEEQDRLLAIAGNRLSSGHVTSAEQQQASETDDSREITQPGAVKAPEDNSKTANNQRYILLAIVAAIVIMGLVLFIIIRRKKAT